MSCMLVPQLILFWLSDTLGSCGNWNQLKGKLCWDLGLEMGMGNWLFTTCQLHETVCSAYVYRVQAGIDQIVEGLDCQAQNWGCHPAGNGVL